MTLKDALSIAVKVLSKTLDTAKLTTDKGKEVSREFCWRFKVYDSVILMPKMVTVSVELATLTREGDKTVTRILSTSEVEALIAAYEKSEAEAQAMKKEKQTPKP